MNIYSFGRAVSAAGLTHADTHARLLCFSRLPTVAASLCSSPFRTMDASASIV
ncbi:MAG: hypothetical protein OCU16_06320 [Candidatus Methanospirare jalkutatii]|nr:hypothetical protein [Candidatus Methanospirare jalkutatii]